jgi:hypothetical protein
VVTNRAGDGDAKYDAYTQTVLEFPGVPGARLDLRTELDDSGRATLRSVGLEQPFAILTAENPHGRNEEDAPSRDEEDAREADNDRRLAALVARLGAEQVPFVRIDGVAPDGSYRERCVAVLLPREEAVALAGRLAQLALFWFDGAAFWLLPAVADAAPRRLPAG